MLRSLLGVFLGIITVVVTVGSVQRLSHRYYPPKENLTPDNVKGMVDHLSQLPFGAFAFLLVSYVLAVFLGTLIASRLSHSRLINYIPSIFTLIAVLFGFLYIPHPLWFVITSILAIIITAILAENLGFRLKRKV